MSAARPVIFISYSHTDEPWLTYVMSFLQPAMKRSGIFDVWSDQDILGGAEWEQKIKDKLAVCNICILLVSRHALDSDYCIDIEVRAIRERQHCGEEVYIYPIKLTPVPEAALLPVRHLNLRPRDGRPLSGFAEHERDQAMSVIVDEIAEMLGGREVVSAALNDARHPEEPSERSEDGVLKDAARTASQVTSKALSDDGRESQRSTYVNVAGLPETAYERLVGREGELKRLDEAWVDANTNILSLIAEGGAGKSALVNEWLKRLQADNYRGAETVLGWSFYSQGSKERVTSADAFLNWALDKLGITLETTSATAKGEAIAEELMRRRVLLVLDGVEPLQHGLDTQVGQLKDQGLRAVLRRFAATPPDAAHGLVVLTSRLVVKDIGRWHDSAAPVVDVERLSDEAGAALLRDNGVWGTDKELRAATHDFGGHPLALGLLASFLKETQTGGARRRDHIRSLLSDTDNPGHDHARRVMESYEKEWLARQPVLLTIMYIVGLFDRPATGDCIRSLRENPPISAFDDRITNLSDYDLNRAIKRLRDVSLLAPAVTSTSDSLDAHPLVREWFGERLRQTNEGLWQAAHGQLYDHLRDTTREGKTPTLEDLGPLYQAIRHGCLAGRHNEVLDDIYRDRICRRGPGRNLEHYAVHKLGAIGSDLAGISWFFDKPYVTVSENLSKWDQIAIERLAANYLRAQGRFTDALPIQHKQLKRLQSEFASGRTGLTPAHNLARLLINLTLTELLVGHIAEASDLASNSVEFTNRFVDRPRLKGEVTASLAMQANVLSAAGQRSAAKQIYTQREQFLRRRRRHKYGLDTTYALCDLLLDVDVADCLEARERAKDALTRISSLLDKGLYTLILGRAYLALAMKSVASKEPTTCSRDYAHTSGAQLDKAADGLRAAGQNGDTPRGLLARAAFRRSVGEWDSVASDLDEIEEIAEPGPMRLYLCDMALERTRLAFARIEAFAPLNGMLEKDNPAKPIVPSRDEIAQLKGEAEKQLEIAAEYIDKCGYHRRDEELAELQAVLKGEKTFASLPPRV